MLSSSAVAGFNVLVYTGDGAGPDPVHFTLRTLKSFLGHRYAVREITPELLKTEPWEGKTALLVFPGGRDMPFVRDMSGIGDKRIKNWVLNGGRYLGFCAGGYFGSSRCEFEPGTKMEVIGDRELKFYPGTCRGAVYPGFEYNSHNGARAVEISVNKSAFERVNPEGAAKLKKKFRVYFNGGGYFVDAHRSLTVLWKVWMDSKVR